MQISCSEGNDNRICVCQEKSSIFIGPSNEFVVNSDANYFSVDRYFVKVLLANNAVEIVYFVRETAILIIILLNKDLCEVGHSVLFVRLFEIP